MLYTTYTAIDQYYSLLKRTEHSLPYVPNTTLNDALNVYSGDTGVDIRNAKTKYLAIGDGGHYFSGTDSSPIMSFRERNGRYSGLYNIVPWVIRDINDDLDPVEIQKYRMRVIENHNGSTKVAYYLKVLEVPTPSFSVETTSNCETSSIGWTPSVGELVHQEINSNSDTSSSRRLLIDLEYTLEITPEERDDLENVSIILYGDPEALVLSEYGLYSGVDATVNTDVNGISIPRPELMNAYLSVSSTSRQPLGFGVAAAEEILRIGQAFSYV